HFQAKAPHPKASSPSLKSHKAPRTNSPTTLHVNPTKNDKTHSIAHQQRPPKASTSKPSNKAPSSYYMHSIAQIEIIENSNNGIKLGRYEAFYSRRAVAIARRTAGT